MKIKVVFDTNVLISSTLWDGSVAQKLLFKLIEKDAFIFSSTDILEEYQRILKRDFDYSEEEMANILKRVLWFIRLVVPQESIDIVKEDKDDNKILECAVEAEAGYVITYDKHLLKLESYKNIKIIKPEEMLKLNL